MDTNDQNHENNGSPPAGPRRTIDEVLSIAEEARERFRTLEAAMQETSSAGRPSAIDEELSDLGATPGPGLSERVYQRAREIIQDAYENASEIRLDALRRVEAQLEKTERQASDVVARAQTEAETVRSQAAVEAKLLLQRAERNAGAIIADAKQQFGRVLQAATEEAERIRAEAQREAAEVMNQAQLSLSEARQRSSEAARLEAEFDRAAREFVKWLGLETKQEQSLFGRVLRRSR
jgi:hypothetical protein